MNSRQSFKVAFLATCARDGLSLSESQQRVRQALTQQQARLEELQKQASIGGFLAEIPEGLARMGSSAISAIVPPALSMGTTAAILAPLAVGGGAGWLAARAQDDDSDIDEAKADELISEYSRLAEQARRGSANQPTHAASRPY